MVIAANMIPSSLYSALKESCGNSARFGSGHALKSYGNLDHPNALSPDTQTEVRNGGYPDMVNRRLPMAMKIGSAKESHVCQGRRQDDRTNCGSRQEDQETRENCAQSV